MHHKKMIFKIAALISALAALNVSLAMWGYSMALPMWAMWVILVASIISLVGIGMWLMNPNKCCHSGEECR
jgi:hypothetical protein